jgi:hypothetical protein
MTVGRWRAGKADFDVVFALKPDELAQVLKNARARPDGEYESTDVAIAIVANTSSDTDQPDRALAKKLLQQQSRRATSLVQRLNARAAIITGKRN